MGIQSFLSGLADSVGTRVADVKEYLYWFEIYESILNKAGWIITVIVLGLIIDRVILHIRLNNKNNKLEEYITTQPKHFEEVHSQLNQSQIQSEISEIKKQLKNLKLANKNSKLTKSNKNEKPTKESKDSALSMFEKKYSSSTPEYAKIHSAKDKDC